MEEVDLSGMTWMKGQPQYKANGCLGVFFPFIDRTVGKLIPQPPSIPNLSHIIFLQTSI
jgi:hypothetical protein